MPNKPVSVSCNLAGTFNNGWTGQQPVWTVDPESLKCRPGNNKIAWTLDASNVPPGFSAAFANPGVVFKPTPPWPGTTPVNKPNGKVTADNDYQHCAQKVKFSYTAFCAVSPNPGTLYPPQTFSYDPDVENDTGGGGGGGRLAAPKKKRPAAKSKSKSKSKPKAKSKAKARPKAKKAKTVKKAKKRAGKKR